MKLPVIGITTGDPAGIGPEVVLRALEDRTIFEMCTPVLIGDESHLEYIAEKFVGSSYNFCPLGSEAKEGYVQVVDVANVDDENLRFGQESENTGRASAQYIEKSVELWREGKIDAVATAPISKNALKMAGYKYPGHTEFYAELTGTEEFAMSFFAEKLRVVLMSTHVSLRNAIDLVTTESLVKLIKFADRVLPELIGRKPKIAVAGINPHASEGGMFGDEEERFISPAIEQCVSEGIDVSGPYSPDTIFLRGFKGDFDLVVACYHDQATIAVKSLSFGSSVNVTLGLPIIRTSVDHGTAFDIAGKNEADESSMKAAIKLAAELATMRAGRL